MEIILLLSVIVIAGALWVWSVASIPDKKTFWKYFLTHSLIFIIYSYLWDKYSRVVTGHDEYGLGQIFGRYIIILVCHILIGFIVLRLKLSRLKRNG